MTLIELMMAVAIVGGLIGVATYSVRSLGKGRLRAASRRLAGSIRYCFDRSMTSGQYFRLVLDLSQNRYWIERSDERAYLKRDKERSPGGGKAFDVDAEERRLAAEEAKAAEEEARKLANQSRGGAGLLGGLEPPPRPKRARFQTFKEAALRSEKSLGGVKLVDVYTPRQPEPYKEGRAYLYFFPDGHTERALIHLKQGDEQYSLVVQPLSGRVEVTPGRLEPTSSFDASGQVQ
jgi:general secretion pathway protein H